MNAKAVAVAAGIAPRTKTFVLTDEYGFAYDGGRSSHVLAALARSDKSEGLDSRTRLVAMGLHKCYGTGRMNVQLARRIREQYSPYQICALVAKIADLYDGEPTIGELADFWINTNSEKL